ncbi:hypothetical protein C0J52_01504, partial [Blattella germanica]
YSGSSRFDSGNLSDDPGFDNSSSCYYTPGLARRMQRPWRSSSQSLGYQSPLSQESTLSDSDWLMHHRKSSLGSLPTQSSNIPHQHSSRRLSRTLSLHSRTDDRRGKDVPSPHPVDYGRRMDYQPSTRRSLSMLESGIPIHSDSGDRVLPPLPSRDRRRDSSRSSMYAIQRSADMSNSHYTQYSKSNDESASVRPHHSSSLPTMSRIKSKKSSDLSKTAEKIIREPKIPESESPITPTSRRVSSHRSLLDNGTAIDRTRIPSLTHLRSSSLARDGNKGTNYEETSSTVKKSSSTCSTSDRSILSKFLRQGSEEKDMSKGTEPADDNKDDTKKKRRISRFLRPDFYDTPREESEYAKKKDAKKAAETESKLKSKNSNKKLDSPPRVSVKNDSEIKAPSISEVPSQTKETESKLKSKTNGKKLANPPLVSVKNGTETKAPNISEVSSQSKETESKLKSKTSFKKLDSPPSVPVKVNSESQTSISEASPQTKEATNKLKSKTNIKKLDNPPSVPEKNGLEQEAKTVSDVSLQAKEAETITKSKTIDEKFDNSVSVPEKKVSESQTTIISENIAQNKESSFVPVAVDKNAVSEQAKKEVKVAKKQNGKQVKAMDESKQNSNVKNGDKKSEANSPVFEKQPSNKNRFLLSLERKLEKFRSSGDDIPSTVNNGKSRVDKAIRSLREQSLSNQGSNITESNLLKRAVSVDDLDSTPKESCGSKIGSKVTSVLGLFKKMEDVPAKTSQSPPKTSVLSRLRRTQSVYAGSQSDSVLVGNANDSNNSTPVPPLRLKKTNSNSSVKNNSINITKKDTTITPKTMTTNKENLCSKDSSRSSEKLSGFSNSETALSNLGQGVTTLLRKGSVKLKAKNKQEGDNINHSEPSLATNHVSGIGINELVIAGSTLKPERPASFCAPLQDSVSAVTPREKEGLLTFNHPRPNSTVISSAPYIEGSNERPVNSTESPVLVPESRISSKLCETVRDENVGINKQLANEKEMISMNADVNTITNGDIPLSNDSNQLPNDDYTLNDDEVKFANVKRVDSCGDECSVVSPADELESLDSWSICSDFDGREFPTSPIPPLGDEVEESVVDRIRRKSFYSRFNDIKKKRKSSLSSLSSPYRDPNSLSSLLYQQSVPRKKEHHHHHHHHSSHREKPSRSQSFYDYDSRFTTFNRKSPLPLRSQTSYQGDLSSNSLGTENDNHDMNGYVESTRELRDENLRGEVPSNVHCLGGSMETLRMPRHFNSKINLGTPSYHVPTYSGPVRRASDSHLSRSMESSVGSIIPRSQLPISTSRYSSTLISPSDSMMRMGDTLPMHGKYTRYKSPNPLDSPPMFHIGSLTPDEEYERPITPH